MLSISVTLGTSHDIYIMNISVEYTSFIENVLHRSNIRCIPCTDISTECMSLIEHDSHIGDIGNIPCKYISIECMSTFEHALHRGNVITINVQNQIRF